MRAYELDPRFAALLRGRYRDDPRITVWHRDFRTVRAAGHPDVPVGLVHPDQWVTVHRRLARR